MRRNLAAYTTPGIDYQSLVSINETDDGDAVEIIIRSKAWRVGTKVPGKAGV